MREDQAPLGSRHHPSTGQGGHRRGHAGHTQQWYGMVWSNPAMVGYSMVIISDDMVWYGMVGYGMVWSYPAIVGCGMVRYSRVWSYPAGWSSLG